MSGPEIQLVDTGTANLASVSAAFRRLGARPTITSDPVAVSESRFVVLPGVGAFETATRRLTGDGLAGPLRERMEAGRPTLAICLGLQLCCATSDESPGVEGLGLLNTGVGRFDGSQRVPQLGWNRVEPTPGCQLLEPGWAVFANTYRLAQAPAGWQAANTDYGGDFVSALERGAVLLCQFHPELSGSWGSALIERWIQRGKEA